MINPKVILDIFIILGVIWTAGCAAVVARSGRATPLEQLEGAEARLRIGLLGGLGGAAIVLFFLTLHWLPYGKARRAELGSPEVAVAATGMQWTWILSRDQVPADVVVEFKVTTLDVNHDFAIYDANGRLLTQVQAMPGYTNRLLYVFHAPGTYTVRCLEYCGIGHHMMTVPLTVTARPK
ncbi:MAG TPA: hypothetical protein VJO52_08200 [Gemmatimonadaceae bacterium]|nr:hypothetical protein [Gemmatimonadaceae bacterium]